MWIKSVILDGFKSYGQRTEISGFDPYFNAITGLNGSGKSNILDGICFLLGITNLSHVRAVNLSELVYKNGQGAVTKATVCITFDNTDASQSPPGFSEFEEITITRQIAIGGRNKYMINGVAASNQRVQDLFRSIQLNVNNPHFLIMQGRITKVLNMKPQEILSMIEEATGTMMFENKKEVSQKIIDKKNAKIKEMDELLNEDIIPRLTKYREERASYLEYQKIVRELEHLNKFTVAFRYFCYEEARKKSSTEIESLKEQMGKCKTEIANGEKRIKDLNKELKELHDKQQREVEATLNVLQGKLNEALNAETIVTSSLNNKKTALEAESNKLQEMERQLAEERNSLSGKKNDLQNLEAELKRLKEKSEKDAVIHSEAVRHLQAVRVGMTSNKEGKDASVDEQLRFAKIAMNNAETEFKQTEIRLKHCRGELKTKLGAQKRDETSYKVDQEKCKQLEKSIEKLEAEIRQLDYKENSEEELVDKIRQMDMREIRLREQLHNLEARFHQLQFEYQDPEPNFNRRSVRGLVAMLINVPDQNNVTALEVVAGGKLFQVVVDTEVTGKKLLDRGRLKKKVTIIPLNKIAGKPIPEHVVRKAESLVGRENVSTALSLVGYDAELEAAMMYVFGSSFVCTNMDVAKRVTFDESIKKKTVTLDGDTFEPAGIASGGARMQSESILLKLHEFKEVQQLRVSASQELSKLKADHRNIHQMATRWQDCMQQLDLKKSELRMLEEKLKNSAHGQQLSEIKDLEAMIVQLEDQLKQSQEDWERYSRRAEELEDMLKNKDAVMEKEVKRAEADLQAAKKEIENSGLNLKKKEQEYNNLRLEYGELEKELGELSDQIGACKETITGMRHQIALQEKEWATANAKVVACQRDVNKQNDLAKNCNKDAEKNHLEQQEILVRKNEMQLQIDELQHKLSLAKQESKETKEQFEELITNNPWVQEEKKYFNQSNTPYDFRERNPTEVMKKINKLKSMKDKLSKNVNMRVMSMLSESEAQYNEVSEKRQSLIKDKEKIQQTIDILDEKKNKAVKEAYLQVNKDFGSIFSSLLPGASAKLVPSEADCILSGIEFRVGFSGVWKESLSELSGGQRSLVALSLILAMLLFKPAPLYILDEVDAALDISHTQNIGQMLKMHFKQSQFIVVSLKEGMFNNANVLFKTKFVDGVSTVARYGQKQAPQETRHDQSRKRKKAV